MEMILIDLLGALFGMAITVVFFETVWVRKKAGYYTIILGVLLFAATNVILTPYLQNTVLLPLKSFALMLFISLYFDSKVKAKVLFSFIVAAIRFASELLVGMTYIDILGVSVNQFQETALLYLIGVATSNLLTLLFVYIIRLIMKGYKKGIDNQFSWIMIFVPIQSIFVCFFIFFYSINAYDVERTPLDVFATLISLSLVFITMVILRNLQKTIAYKNASEMAEKRLEMQLRQSHKLYQEQTKIRKIRHDISNELISLFGTLESGNVADAVERINALNSDISDIKDNVYTGLPEVDAVISSKLDKAESSGIKIVEKININQQIDIDSYDFAGIVANALDNAIEGILRSNEIEKSISLKINTVPGYLVIDVENFASGTIHQDFRTSKLDNKNHGFGIEQMKAVATKYGGNVKPEYDPQKMVFSLKVLLKLSKQ